MERDVYERQVKALTLRPGRYQRYSRLITKRMKARRFGEKPASVLTSLGALSAVQIYDLALELSEFNSYSEVQAWLSLSGTVRWDLRVFSAIML